MLKMFLKSFKNTVIDFSFLVRGICRLPSPFSSMISYKYDRIISIVEYLGYFYLNVIMMKSIK